MKKLNAAAYERSFPREKLYVPKYAFVEHTNIHFHFSRLDVDSSDDDALLLEASPGVVGFYLFGIESRIRHVHVAAPLRERGVVEAKRGAHLGLQERLTLPGGTAVVRRGERKPRPTLDAPGEGGAGGLRVVVEGNHQHPGS